MSNHILNLSVPLFLVLIALELYADKKRKTGFYRINDAYSSLVLGITSQTSKLLFLTSGVALGAQLAAPFVLLPFSTDVFWHWLVAFILYDFIYYWSHRFAHSINILWAGHVIHHQSEDFNLTTALRQPSTQVFNWIFSLPLLVLGVPLEMLVTCISLNLLYQFWIHTRHIHNAGFLEQFMVTPSHHRVHHGQNPIYIDRNHGGVLIIWDKLFGTFQKELTEQPVIYGVSRASNTFDPLKANVQFYYWLMQDALSTANWWDKVRIWFMPTGWRPPDMESRYPTPKHNLAKFTSYDPPVPRAIKAYALLQLVAALPMMGWLLLLHHNSPWPVIACIWSLSTLPLIMTGKLLDGLNPQWEWLRLLFSWLLLALFYSHLAIQDSQVLLAWLLFSTFLFAVTASLIKRREITS